MSLRRKILLNFLMLASVNGLVTLFVIEAAYLAKIDFKPGSDPLAPGLGLVALSLILGAFLVSILLYWTLRRLVLAPLEEIIAASRSLADGEAVALYTAGRHDEMGRLADSFHLMAETIMEARQNQEEKIRQAGERISAAQRELAFTERLAATGKLAAGVAHEINNPLGGVMNAMARLRKGGLAPEREEMYWRLCDEGLERIRNTVRRILDFSRKRPEVRLLSLPEELRKSLDLAGHLIDPARVRVVSALPAAAEGDGGLFSVLADAGDLQHVFLNLLLNALDAMPDGGELGLAVERSGDCIRTEIRDSGVGLTPEELSASFEFFHTTKPVGKGTGLGLSIAHHIVAGYRGSLHLESAKGVGTRAIVTLPAAAPADNALQL